MRESPRNQLWRGGCNAQGTSVLYRLTAELLGYHPVTQDGIPVETGRTYVAEIVMGSLERRPREGSVLPGIVLI